MKAGNNNMELELIEHNLSFSGARTKRSKTTAIVLHHTACTTGTIESIHKYHLLTMGWLGIGYNVVVYKDGTIHLGRGLEYVGAHAGVSNNYNSKSIGVNFIGYFHDGVEKTMPDAQFNAGVKLIAYLKEKYPTITEIVKHSDVCATSCPGSHFPFSELISGKLRGAANTNEEEEDMTRYNKLEEIPESLRPHIKKLVEKKIISGNGEGNLDLSLDMIRLLVFNDRAGLYG